MWQTDPSKISKKVSVFTSFYAYFVFKLLMIKKKTVFLCVHYCFFIFGTISILLYDLSLFFWGGVIIIFIDLNH